MALVVQLILFVVVSVVFVGFTFAWGEYKGRQRSNDDRSKERFAGGER